MPRAKVKAKSEGVSHKARRARRLQIAKAIAKGMSRGDAAEKFEVTSATVRAAVAEFPSIAKAKASRN